MSTQEARHDFLIFQFTNDEYLDGGWTDKEVLTKDKGDLLKNEKVLEERNLPLRVYRERNCYLEYNSSMALAKGHVETEEDWETEGSDRASMEMELGIPLHVHG